MTVIPALGRVRHEKCEFKPFWAAQQDTVSKEEERTS
jgi:hypothetical protein